MAAALRAAGGEVAYDLLAGAGHVDTGATPVFESEENVARAVAFLDAHLLEMIRWSTMNRDEIVRELIRIGEQAIVREDDAALDAFFAPDFVFHGPQGDADLPALKRLWAAQRDAFTDFTITRGHIVVEGDFVAAQTTFTGVFERELTQSPVGPLPPTGTRFTLNLINIFRYDAAGRLAEEWVQYDNRGLLRQLGAEGQ